jgi:hypothetical protein
MKDSVTDSLADYDELVVLEPSDVPEPVEIDPIEERVTEEIVVLDLVKLGSGEIELL